MMDRLIDIVLGLTLRERLLLLLLVIVVIPAAGYFGGLAPMMAARDAARVEISENQALRRWTLERAEEAGRLELVQKETVLTPIGISGIEASLASAGLRNDLADLQRLGEDRVELRFDAVEFVKLGDWLNQVSLSWGYEIQSYRIDRGQDPGLVTASFTLEPQS